MPEYKRARSNARAGLGMRGALALQILFTIAAAAQVALGQIQIKAEWDAQTQEQNVAAQNPVALGQGIISELPDVYLAAGVEPVVNSPVSVSGQLVPLSGPSPPPPPPGSAPPPAKTPAPASSGLSTSDTVLAGAGIALGVVGLLACAWYACGWRAAIEIGPKLPPVIPYRIPAPAGYSPAPAGYSPAPSAPPLPDSESVHVFKVPNGGY